MRQHQENTLEIAQWLEQQPLVRLSVGFEQVSDLLRDLERALSRVADLETMAASLEPETASAESVAEAVGPANDDRVSQIG